MSLYLVTFCAMDEKTGSSPAWHTSLILSELEEVTQRLRVVSCVGYYGLKTDNYPKPSCSRRLKMRVGLNLDLNNHGILEIEKLHYLDQGIGLHGTTFQITKEQFNQIQERIEKTLALQNTAISEFIAEKKLEEKKLDNFKHYPYEHFSRSILDFERKKAAREYRSSRLQIFELSLLPTAYNCKVKALELVTGVLSKEQIRILRGLHTVIPRFTGSMTTIALYSEGPLRTHIKKNGETVKTRDSKDGCNVFWSVPPLVTDTKSPSLKTPTCLKRKINSILPVNHRHYSCLIKLVSQLQQIEKIFQNYPFAPQEEPYRDELLAIIQSHYKGFSTLEFKPISYPTSFLKRCLFGQPENSQEKRLLLLMKDAKNFLNNLYMAIVDCWKLDIEDERKIVPDEDEEDCDPEALAGLLPTEKQKKICKIMGRPYSVDRELRLVR